MMRTKSEQVKQLGKVMNNLVECCEVLNRHFKDDREFSLLIDHSSDEMQFLRGRGYLITVKPLGQSELKQAELETK